MVNLLNGQHFLNGEVASEHASPIKIFMSKEEASQSSFLSKCGTNVEYGLNVFHVLQQKPSI